MSPITDPLSRCLLAAVPIASLLLAANFAQADSSSPAASAQTQPASAPSSQPETQPQAEPLDQQLLDWNGARPFLKKYGLTFQGTLTADFTKVLAGGINTRANIVRDLLDIRLILDTNALAKWKGGTFSVDFQNQSGRNAPAAVGSVQVFDNADADGRTQISELWYQQLLLDDRLRIKLGKIDANADFALPSYNSNFLNSSWTYSPTIIGLPTYPDPATGINIFLTPAPWFYAGAGIYDGAGRSHVQTGSYGPANLWHSGESYFMIGETGLRWQLADSTLPGRFALGGSYHTGEFATFNAGAQSGASSEYLIAEQKIWHKYGNDKTNPAGVYLSLQYGHADRNVSPVTDHLDLAAVWIEPYRKANPDSLGLGATAVRLTDESGARFTRDDETAIEAYYNFQITSYFSIRPDFQYIINPGGNRDTGNAAVFTLRAVFNF